MKRTIFLDSVGLLALWDESDQWHGAAERAYADIRHDRARLITTSFVLLECGNAAARHPYRDDVIALKRKLEARQALIEPTPSGVEQAWAGYRQHEAANAGIVDCVSFVVMRRLGITDAVTHNGHFKAAGFVTLF